ncbi:MAG: phage tail protein [Oscillospiraceae bacterium]|nr:phage tail protein [Oscillospiraceae bacterium]
MKRFSDFGSYMFYLLFAPLKKGQQALNQFAIFFRVVGRIFDEMKEDIFRVREEADIATCSTVMLPVHGQDRGMSRLDGEAWELYRARLLRKGIVAAQAGTAEGVVALVKSLGYEQVYIEPLYLTDPTRWAEATVWISGGSVVVDDRDIIQQEINRIKPGTNLLHLAHEQIYGGTVLVGLNMQVYKIMDVKQV